MSQPLSEGEQIFRVTIDGSYVNLDKIEFSCTDCESGEGTSLNLTFATDEGVYNVYSPLGYYVAQIKCDAGEALYQILYDVVKEPGLYILVNVETGESSPCIAK